MQKNGEELGSVPAMSQAEVDEVYAAAKAALPAWRALSYACLLYTSRCV